MVAAVLGFSLNLSAGPSWYHSPRAAKYVLVPYSVRVGDDRGTCVLEQTVIKTKQYIFCELYVDITLSLFKTDYYRNDY